MVVTRDGPFLALAPACEWPPGTPREVLVGARDRLQGAGWRGRGIRKVREILQLDLTLRYLELVLLLGTVQDNLGSR